MGNKGLLGPLQSSECIIVGTDFMELDRLVQTGGVGQSLLGAVYWPSLWSHGSGKH